MTASRPSPSSLFTHRSLLWTMGMGFLLLTGVILFSEDINAALTSATATVIDQPLATTSAISSPTTSQSTVVSVSTILPVDDIQAILNHPENFRVVPSDIMPAQAIIEGKTTKFLMGL